MSVDIHTIRKGKHTNISDGVQAACWKNPSKVAYKHGQKTRTYQELKQRIDLTSGIIYKLSIPFECNIAIVASNSIELDATIAIFDFNGISEEDIIPAIASILWINSL